ncbi:unnamed protein product [Musa acuminata subsp. malaccensis]|uniref:(wild Malaysian banana) hypothetical protein n=1 Tax=Musa acuminata subsp. malaccensis TaxID=214687 RepID=A0A8D7F8P7_MUSAM|nr:unnamed protein product [Musa acuminata subsp. malaccensis]
MADKAAKLKTLGMNIDESFLVQFILNSLPSQFGPFKIHYNTNKDKWDLNELTSMYSGASTHVTNNMQGFLSIRKPKEHERFIIMGNRLKAKVISMGTYRYCISFGSGKLSIFYDSIKVGSGILCDGLYGKVYLIHEKSQAVDTLEVYINEVERQLDRKVNIVRSDKGESDYDIGIKRDPLSFSQAIESNDSEKWYDAMKEELKSMVHNDVWDLVELPNDCKRVGCKWVFKTKRDSTGNIKRYKARLVAKDFSQKESIDYNETFSPVSKKDSLRIVMTLVAHYDLELHQMDVKTAFLNGDLDEEIYME